MWTCKHCKEVFDFSLTHQKANHSRWCCRNPDRDNWNKNQGILNTYGSLKEYLVDCCVCGDSFKIIEREKLHPQKDRYFCGISCRNSLGGKARKALLLGQDRLSYRTICWMHHSKECIVCGENKIVEVHHFDGNSKNNAPENLIPLCPTHHQYCHSRYKDLITPVIQQYLEKFQSEISP